ADSLPCLGARWPIPMSHGPAPRSWGRHRPRPEAILAAEVAALFRHSDFATCRGCCTVKREVHLSRGERRYRLALPQGEASSRGDDPSGRPAPRCGHSDFRRDKTAPLKDFVDWLVAEGGAS